MLACSKANFFASFFFVNVSRAPTKGSRITGRYDRSIANRTANLILITLLFETTLHPEASPSPLTSVALALSKQIFRVENSTKNSDSTKPRIATEYIDKRRSIFFSFISEKQYFLLSIAIKQIHLSHILLYFFFLLITCQFWRMMNGFTPVSNQILDLIRGKQSYLRFSFPVERSSMEINGVEITAGWYFFQLRSGGAQNYRIP